MTTTNATSLRKDLFNVLDNVVLYNETINVTTKNGNAIIMSQEDYDGIIATLELYKDANLKAEIVKGKNIPVEECVDFDEVKW